MAEFPDFVLSTTEKSLRVSRAVTANKLRPLGNRLHTTHLRGDPSDLIRQNVWTIAALYFPGGLVADRTAFEMKPARDGRVFLVADTKRSVELPGISLHARTGTGRIEGDFPMRDGLYCSSRARAFVENMRPSRARSGVARTASRLEIEEQLTKYLRSNGEDGLNHLRDRIKDAGKSLGLSDEAAELDGMIGTLLGTRAVVLTAPSAIAFASGTPFDTNRVKLFEALHDGLRGMGPQLPRTSRIAASEVVNFAFFEAYFSNFIEGTEFEVDEAEDIIFNGAIPDERRADAHDILGTFAVLSDPEDRGRVPTDFEEFTKLLKRRHAKIMEGRPEKRPGEFKTAGNKAGSTTFVRPEEVVGTLQRGFQIYQRLDTPLDRAIFMMFLVAEVHPFADGNGRSARIMMNAELSGGGETRIIIPTVFRSNYLESLRLMSNHGVPDALIRTHDFAQRYAQAIEWSSLPRAISVLRKTNAFVLPEVGDREGYRLRLPRAVDFEDDDDNDGGDGTGGAMAGGPRRR
ncbi:Fic family protein [Rhizobium leguminosarum]|uniref:Fic family protein n=1 Tax=Rhizobium leguminosarum TaxID=384 RepID=UPI00103057AC|nr:Fic family protein [Rhizobium leguminosarum]TBF36988.1 Fic family protein [Rhizobium leguminosarum]